MWPVENICRDRLLPKHRPVDHNQNSGSKGVGLSITINLRKNTFISMRTLKTEAEISA